MKRYRCPGGFIHTNRYLDKLHRGSETGIESMSVKLVYKIPCKIHFLHQIQTPALVPLLVTRIVMTLLMHDSRILVPISGVRQQDQLIHPMQILDPKRRLRCQILSTLPGRPLDKV